MLFRVATAVSLLMMLQIGALGDDKYSETVVFAGITPMVLTMA